MTELVGFAKCPCCGFESAGVFRNKRKKLVLNCRKKEGGEGCSTFLFQSNTAQESLKNRTRFISENPAPVVEPSEIKAEPVAVVPVPEPAPVVSEKVAAVVPEEIQKTEPAKPAKERFSFFK